MQQRIQHAVLILLTITLLISVGACGTGNAGNESTEGTAMPTNVPGSPLPVGARRPWNTIHNWVYWLDTPKLQQISATNFELAVIDYSADGSAAGAFTAQQINALRQTTCQRRVVAYLSIGEAESYRWYWHSGWQTGNPGWLGPIDPNWTGNYWVNYWDPAWQQLIYRYLDKIIAADFDGVYLDRIDAYQESYATGHEDDMVQFVSTLAQYARSHSPLGSDFGIIVQNAEGLGAKHPDYVRLVTGIGREEVYVRATNKPTSAAARTRMEQSLDLFRQNSQGHLVLTVDYANQPDLVSAAYQQSQAKGYVPYVTTVKLNRLQINAGYQPTCQSIGQK
jgi:cysteinyl-tRNA synthetase